MNGDGVPEITYQQSDGPSFADTVMTFSSPTMTWEERGLRARRRRALSGADSCL